MNCKKIFFKIIYNCLFIFLLLASNISIYGNSDTVEAAKKTAQSTIKFMPYSRDGLVEALVSIYGYSREDTEKAVDSLDIDWKLKATESAEMKIKYIAYSKEGLIDTLVSYDKFSHQDAEYAVNSLNIDWNQQALASVEMKLQYLSYSRSGLIDTLVSFDKFTREEAEYAVDAVEADWKQQAVESAKTKMKYLTFSDQQMRSSLQFDGFTDGEITYALSVINGEQEASPAVNKNSEENRGIEKAKSYLKYNYSRIIIIDKLAADGFSLETAARAVDNCGVNWNDIALNKTKSYLKYNYSKSTIYSKLLSDQFTEEQAQYAVENCGANWNSVAYNKALSYVKYNYSNEKIYNKLLTDGFNDEQAAVAIYCLEDSLCDETSIIVIADRLVAEYNENTSDEVNKDEMIVQNNYEEIMNVSGNNFGETQTDGTDNDTTLPVEVHPEIISDTEHKVSPTITTPPEDIIDKDLIQSDRWEINAADDGIRISSTDANLFNIRVVEIGNGESLQSDRNLMINISINEQGSLIFLLMLDDENNTYNAFPLNKTNIYCFVSSDPDDSIPSTGNFSDWNSAVALGGTVILGKENNAEFIRGLQTGYLSVVLFHIDQESGLGIFCNSELTDIIGFEDAVMTAESLTK